MIDTNIQATVNISCCISIGHVLPNSAPPSLLSPPPVGAQSMQELSTISQHRSEAVLGKTISLTTSSFLIDNMTATAKDKHGIGNNQLSS